MACALGSSERLGKQLCGRSQWLSGPQVGVQVTKTFPETSMVVKVTDNHAGPGAGEILDGSEEQRQVHLWVCW